MPLIYEGPLSDEITNYISSMLKQYNYVIEISSLPDNWHEWSNENVISYDAITEDCMGRSCSHKTKMYAIVNINKESAFLLFKAKEEKDAFVHDFPDLVINETPFRTLIE